MKVLFVGYFTAKGGSAKATIPLALTLRSQGYQVNFAHWSLPEQIELFTQNNLLDFYLHQQKNLLAKIIYLTQLARQYDLIIAVSELTITYACQLAGWFTGKPVLAEIQVNLDLWIKEKAAPMHYQLTRFFYPQLQGVRCVSNGLKDYAICQLKIAPEKVFTIYNPFNLAEIKALSQEPLPEVMNSWFTNPVIICLGRLESQKRFDLAIESLSLVSKKYQYPVNLIILGDGSEKENLQQKINKLELNDRVYLAGFYENPYPFLAAAKLFLLSSDYEGFGRVIVDAMAVGCPVIANDCPYGPGEILDQGKYGILISNNQPETIANQIIYLLENQEICAEFRDKGKTRSLDFSEDIINEQYAAKINSFMTTYI